MVEVDCDQHGRLAPSALRSRSTCMSPPQSSTVRARSGPERVFTGLVVALLLMASIGGDGSRRRAAAEEAGIEPAVLASIKRDTKFIDLTIDGLRAVRWLDGPVLRPAGAAEAERDRLSPILPGVAVEERVGAQSFPGVEFFEVPGPFEDTRVWAGWLAFPTSGTEGLQPLRVTNVRGGWRGGDYYHVLKVEQRVIGALGLAYSTGGHLLGVVVPHAVTGGTDCVLYGARQLVSGIRLARPVKDPGVVALAVLVALLLPYGDDGDCEVDLDITGGYLRWDGRDRIDLKDLPEGVDEAPCVSVVAARS